MAQQSGLQRSVLGLYRSCFRAIRTKPPEARENFRRFVRNEFRKYASSVNRRDFATVEYLLRRGERQLETYSGAGTTNIAG